MWKRGCSQCCLFLFLNLFSTFESTGSWFAEVIWYLMVVISLIVKYEEFGDVFHLAQWLGQLTCKISSENAN